MSFMTRKVTRDATWILTASLLPPGSCPSTVISMGSTKARSHPRTFLGLNILNSLMPAALARSLIFAGQEIHLHGDFEIARFQLSQKNEGLFTLKISSAQK